MTVAGAATAQDSPRMDPRDPKAPAQPAEYRSAFADYRRYDEPQIADWRALNDEVGRVGGHLGIVRERRETAREQPKPSAHGMRHQ